MAKKGRPTKYKEKYVQAMLDFFSEDLYHYEDVEKATPRGVVSIREKVANRLPTFERFADLIGVHFDTLHEWANATHPENKDELLHPEFSDAYKKCKLKQKEFLIQNGMNGLYNTTFTIFVAKHITDMKDSKQVELTGKDGAPLYGIKQMMEEQKEDESTETTDQV